MKLYARRSSSSSQKVLWFLDELGLEYEFAATGGDEGGLDKASYLALNPNGKVPTWVDQNGPVWESQTILRYLAAEYGAPRWWSESPSERSLIDRWMDWSQTKFDEAFMPLFWAYWRTPEEERSQRVISRLLSECGASISLLERQLSDHDYLAGQNFSLADVPAGSLMYRYAQLDVTDDIPATVQAWYERLIERTPYRTHIMRPFDELKGKLAY